MKSNKVKLGSLIELVTDSNIDMGYDEDSVRGISIEKKFIPTKADLTDVNLKNYTLVKPKSFAYVTVTSRNGEKISLAYNFSNETYLVSSTYVVFDIKSDKLLPEYLYMFFNRSSFDRYSRFNSWGSARETFTWEDMCNVEIELPDKTVQQKYVDIYMGLKSNIETYEKGIDELKNAYTVYLEKIKHSEKFERIGKYVMDVDERNENNQITLAQGVTVDLIFTDPKRVADDTESAKIVRNGQFAYNKVMKAGGTKLPIALRKGDDCVISNSYQVFEVTKKDSLLPEYLMMWMSRPETQRYAGYISWGTTRDIYSFENLCETKIPLPSPEIQQDIVNIYNTYTTRKNEIDKLKSLLKSICPILIKGSNEEAQ